MRNIFFVFLMYGVLACENTQTTTQLNFPEKPNILWLVAEDLSPMLAPFGDSTAFTPNINRLANEGIRYPNMFSTHGVCAPSRAAIITGMYPSGIGANHMRTNSNMDFTGLPAYEAVPPSEVKMFTEYLRKEGYYTTNNSKKDYQFTAQETSWDESGNFAHWRNRAQNQPFFAVFNFNITHESSLFEPYGFKKDEARHYESGNRDFQLSGWNVRTTENDTPILVSKDSDFPIPPYLPNTEIVQRDLWKAYNNIAEMDRQLGAILNQLEEDGLLESTIVFFYGDHGGPLPRQKRLIYDSGIRTPLIIRYPNQQQAGTVDNQLISFVDFAPTLLSLVGIESPEYIQGQAFLGDFKSEEKRVYIHAATDRLDEFTDARRAVRDSKFKYIRNFRPNQGYYLPVAYREQIPTMQELLRLRDEGKLNDIQNQWFRNEKPSEELFDLENDPHELNNLANDFTHRKKLLELSLEMDRWLNEIGDDPSQPEEELISELWNKNTKPPVTLNPIISFNRSGNSIFFSTQTEGSTIGYKLFKKGTTEPTSWSIYSDSELIPINSDEIVKVRAHRVGYKPSEILTQTKTN